jgi:O-antigen/teichoic acid export membrane protein
MPAPDRPDRVESAESPVDDSALASSRRIARNAALRTGGEVVAKLASVAFFVAMARELGQEGFGDFMFALSLSTVLILAAGFGTEELITREVARDRGRVHGYLSNVMAVKALTSVALLLVVVAIVNVGGYSSEARIAVYLVSIGTAVENFGRTWHSVFQAYERMELISISLILQRVLTAGIGIGVLLSGGGLIAVSIVFMGGAVVGVLTANWALRRFVVAPRWELDRSRWVSLVRAGLPIGIAALLFTVLLRVDASLLSFLKGGDNSEVGIYGAAFRLIEATLFISWAFTAAMLPWMARQEGGAGLARGYELGLKAMSAVLLPIGLGFVLLAPQLIDLLYGAAYGPAVTPLRLLGAMTVLYGINSFAATLLIARDRPGDFTRIVGLVAAQNIAFNFILIPPYGADGAALNAALSGLLLAGLSIWKVTSTTGAISLVRAFAGPVAGGVAMTAVILLTDLPLVPAALAGVAAFLVVLLAFERVVFHDDFARLRELLRRRGEPRPADAARRLEPTPTGVNLEA